MNNMTIQYNLRRFRSEIFPNEAALRAFSICAAEIETLGIGGIKKKTKARFRKFMLANHPDTKKRTAKGMCSVKTGTWLKHENRSGFEHVSFWFKKYREIMGLKYLPLTPFNFEKILEAQKGFKTTADIDFGLNGPDDYGKTTGLLSGQVHHLF